MTHNSNVNGPAPALALTQEQRMKRIGRYLTIVAREGLPALKGVRALLVALGGAATVAALLLANVLLALVVGLAVVLGVVLVGGFRAWSAAEQKARAYEGDSELQQGIATYIRRGRELRQRLATTTDDRVAHIEDDVFQWAGDVFQFFDQLPAWELAGEWGALEGVQAGSSDEFARDLGGVSRALPKASLVDYVDRGMAQLVAFQRRLQG